MFRKEIHLAKGNPAQPRQCGVRRSYYWQFDYDIMRLLSYLFVIIITTQLSFADQIITDDATQQKNATSIQIVLGDGTNLEIEEIINTNYIVAKLCSPVHNFFFGCFQNLQTTGETTTIGLSLEGNDTDGNRADVTKWANLAPCMSYADPSYYDSFIWYEKDEQGRWVSGDPLACENARYAGTGDVPVQTVIPREVSKAFLSKDGRYWQPWREIVGEAVPGLNIFRMKEAFVLPTASVALRIPYTYTYLQAFIVRLKAAKFPGVFVDELGTTPEGRKLQIIRMEDPALLQQPADHPTICLIAREHASEQASSWALQGTINTLLDGSPQAIELRRGRTWLFVPIEDPDGSAHSTFDHLTDAFKKPNNPNTPPEVFAYARYLNDYVVSGRTIDLVVSLHNVEANECANIFCPFQDQNRQSEVVNFNRLLFDALSKEGYLVGNAEQTWGTGVISTRLYGYISKHFGSTDIVYEVNDRYHLRRLSLAQLQRMGAILAQCISQWCLSDEGSAAHKHVTEIRLRRQKERESYFIKQEYSPNERTKFDILVLGY